MDTIDHNGKTYVKASILAKRHRYTTDYIGQLCRAGKVEAELVGRAWYVDEKSLLNHKIDRKKDTRSNEILSKNSSEVTVAEAGTVKVPIRSTLSKKTHRQFFADELRPEVQHNWQNRAVSYGDDPATLVPQVTNKIVKNQVEALPIKKTVAIPVDLVESEKIKVKDVCHHNHKQHLAFTELPAVLLEGNLKIDDLDVAGDYADSTPVTLADIKPVKENESNISPKTLSYQKKVRPAEISFAPKFAPHEREFHEISITDTPDPEVNYNSVPATSFVNTEKQTVKSRKALFVLPLLLMISVLVTGFSLAFSSITTYTATGTSTSFSFNKSFFGEALLYLTQ